MSQLDLDIRAVSGAASGSRSVTPDMTGDQASSTDQTSQAQSSDTTHSLSANLAHYRYDSLKFAYKPDYGRIVLIEQSPVTGEQISQIPSQRVLELYAEQRRSEANGSSIINHAGNVASAKGRRMANHASAVSAVAVVSIPALTPPPTVARAANPVNITI